MDMLPVSTGLCQALGDPSRLRIAALVREMDLAVGELVQLLGQSQPRVSRHVRILNEAGIIERQKEGSWVFVALADAERTTHLLDALVAMAPPGEAALLKRDLERLEAVRRDRAAAAERFFAARAERWDSVRSLHVAEAEVEQAMDALLDGEPIGRLVDLGTGTGRMLELFAPRASAATGVDRSSDMLRLARVKLDRAGVQGASLRQGDIYALPLEDRCADVVLLHQVLHYVQSPLDAVRESARLLAPGGRLLVADFAPHDREELRRVDAHRRLGFDDRSMRGWFAQAGLEVERTVELTGGSLAVKLWLGRKKGARPVRDPLAERPGKAA